MGVDRKKTVTSGGDVWGESSQRTLDTPSPTPGEAQVEAALVRETLNLEVFSYTAKNLSYIYEKSQKCKYIYLWLVSSLSRQEKVTPLPWCLCWSLVASLAAEQLVSALMLYKNRVKHLKLMF